MRDPVPPGFVDVAHVDEHGEWSFLQITTDAIPAARERGWLVFSDFEASMVPVFNPPRVLDDGHD